jgi:hypothetical protein
VAEDAGKKVVVADEGVAGLGGDCRSFEMGKCANCLGNSKDRRQPLYLASYPEKISFMDDCNWEPDVEECLNNPRYPRRGWIGVDLDGTLAKSMPGLDPAEIGPVVPRMLQRVQHWISTGRTVKIFTARANNPCQILMIQEWCVRQGLPKLEVTDRKDHRMIAIWDDRAVQVLQNTGIPVQHPRTLSQNMRAMLMTILRIVKRIKRLRLNLARESMRDGRSPIPHH